MVRLPNPGSDNGVWGDVLNEFLSQIHATDGTLKDDVVTSSAIAPNAVDAVTIADGSITEALLDSTIQAKLNANDSPDWNDLVNKPAAIAAGATQADARTAIGAGTASTKLDVGLGNVDNTTDLNKPISTATQTALDGKANTSHTHTASQISDSTNTGRSLLSSADATAAKTTLGLNNVDNTSDATKNSATVTLTNKTISGSTNTLSNIAQASVTDLTTDLAGKEPSITGGLSSQYWRGDKTWQSLDKTAVGLPNANNTSDLNKPISTAAQTALDLKADLVGGLIPTSQLPNLVLTDVVTVANEASMLALTSGDVQPGDVAVRTDGAGSFILTDTNPSILANWTLLDAPADAVSSVNGQQGTVVLGAADVGLGNVDNTSDINKPISSATQTALDEKADLIGGIIPSSQLPTLSLTAAVTVADQTAMLALTALQVQPGDLAIRTDGAGTFILTGTDPSILANWKLLNAPTDAVTSVNGQTGAVTLGKTDVGLGSVDNTSDATKNAAAVTLTNKTINGSNNTISNIAQASVTNLTTDLAAKGDASTNTASSVDNEIALFSGTGGKTLKRASGNGIATVTAGVLGTTTAPSGAIVGTTDTQTLSGKTLTNPTVNNYTEGVVAIGTVTTTSTLSLTNGTLQTATLTASTACTFTMPAAAAGKSFTLMLKQPGVTGNGSATFTGVKWNAMGAPTITAALGKMDILSFFSDGTNWYGSYTQGYTP
jgi:hypothetical protein